MDEVGLERIRSADGTEIAFTRGGTGPVLVVVNGALSDRHSTDLLRPRLEPHFTLVGYDRRGRGSSDETGYGLDGEIEDLAAVIDANGGRAFVFGHSSGAVLSLEALIRGVPMLRLAVNEPPYILPGSRPLPPIDIVDQLNAYRQVGDREAMLRLFLLQDVGVPADRFEQMVASPDWDRMLGLAASTRYDAALLRRHELPREALAAIRTPVMVTGGGASFPWIVETARTVAATIPDAEFVLLPNQPHTPAPGAIAPQLIRFLLGTRPA